MTDISPSTLTDLTPSGRFTEMARRGMLHTVSSLIDKHRKAIEKLTEIERSLQACNDPRSLAALGLWCIAKKKNFESEIKKRAGKLEGRKAALEKEIRQLTDELGRRRMEVEIIPIEEELRSDLAAMTSLVPQVVRKEDPFVGERNEVIDANLTLSTQEICRLLDQHFVREGEVCDQLPRTWAASYEVNSFLEAYLHPECRKLVHKLISVRRRLGVTASTQREKGR